MSAVLVGGQAAAGWARPSLRSGGRALVWHAPHRTAPDLHAPDWQAPDSEALSDSAVRALISDRVDSRRSIGLVVGLINPAGRVRVFTAGVSGTARPLDANSVFEIGSVTKTFTAAVLAGMVARGEVRLDDPVAKYLPSTVHVPSRDGRQITLVDLATQTSGLPRLPTNLAPKDPANPYADYSVQQMYDFLSGYQLTRGIGEQYEYSNLGVGLLGHVLALRAGMTYEELVRQRVLVPLGMSDTRMTLTPSMRARLALGHDAAGGVVENWDIPTLAGAGGLRSTMADMLKYLAANLDSARGPLGPVLWSTHATRHTTPNAKLSVGLAWHILTTPSGREIVWHNGGTGGYHSFIGFDPARHVGAVVLSNSEMSIDDIGFHFVDPRMALAPPALPQGNRQEVALAPAVLDRYVGDYALTPAFHIVVTREGNVLYAQATGQQRFQLFAERADEFFLKVVDAQISFTHDAAGAVTGLVLHQGGQDMRGARVR